MEVFDAAVEGLVTLGVVGLREDETGGLEADTNAVVIEGVVENGRGLVGHVLEMGLREFHGLVAEPFEALAEVFIVEPAVKCGAATKDAPTSGLLDAGSCEEGTLRGSSAPAMGWRVEGGEPSVDYVPPANRCRYESRSCSVTESGCTSW